MATTDECVYYFIFTLMVCGMVWYGELLLSGKAIYSCYIRYVCSVSVYTHRYSLCPPYSFQSLRSFKEYVPPNIFLLLLVKLYFLLKFLLILKN